jgi:hypothetical protein
VTFLLYGVPISGISRVGHGERKLNTPLGRFDAETGASITERTRSLGGGYLAASNAFRAAANSQRLALSTSG